MQGKALTALATLLAAVALAACGGGDGDETTTLTATAPEQVTGPEAIEEVQRRAERIEKERRGQPSEERTKPSGPRRDGPVSVPPVEHSDSGGGAAQFQKKGSDNSIQEFGGEGADADRAGAAAVLHAYLDARAARRWEEACSYLSAEVVASLEQFAATYAGDKEIEGCPGVLETLSASTPTSALQEAAQADVGSLRLRGENGFLLYHGPGGVDYAFPVVQEGGSWELAAPDATPLP